MFKDILLLPLILLFFSCSSKKQKVSEIIVPSDFTIIPLHFSDKEVFNVSNLSDEIRYIQFQTSEADIIGKIDKLVLLNDQIFVLDKKISKAVFVFDTLGSLSYKIQILDSKKSPKELRDFSISPEQNLMHIYEPNKSELYKYSLDSGTYLGKLNAIQGNFDYFVTTSDRLLFIRDSRVQYDVLNDLRLCTFDLEGNFGEGWLQKSVFENFSFAMENYDPITTSFVNKKKNIYVTRQFDDTVYYFDDSKDHLVAKYKIDGGINQRTIWNTLYSAPNEAEFLEQYTHYDTLTSLAGNFFDTERFLVFNFLRGNTYGYYIRDKISSKNYTCRYIVNNVDNIPISGFHYMDNNQIVFQVNKQITSERYNSIKDNVKLKTVSPKLKELVLNFKENENPIIALGKLNFNK